jgi:hypothetical protein
MQNLIKKFIFIAVGLFFSVSIYGQQKSVWEGSWKNPLPNNVGYLKIKMISKTKFRFEISSTSGANMGDISGTATIKQSQAFFDDGKSANNRTAAANSGCKLTFIQKAKTIDIRQQGCAEYGGIGFMFSGAYLKGNPKTIEYNLVDLYILLNAAVDAKFKSLVGKNYRQFVEAMMYMTFADDDQDNFGAKVFSGCVRGICPYNAAIIMFDKDSNFWAAFIEIDNKSKAKINYFSNVGEWKNKMPKTIENWVEQQRKFNENLEVVYKVK